MAKSCQNSFIASSCHWKRDLLDLCKLLQSWGIQNCICIWRQNHICCSGVRVVQSLGIVITISIENINTLKGLLYALMENLNKTHLWSILLHRFPLPSYYSWNCSPINLNNSKHSYTTGYQGHHFMILVIISDFIK